VAANFTNFPVLVSLPSDVDLALDAQNDGDDILFTAADGVTQIAHELESYDGATGELIAWVRVANLSSVADTTIYMYYGNPSAASQESPSGLWAGLGHGIWHLDEDPSAAAPQFIDSTSNNNDGSAVSLAAANQVAGQIGGSLQFDDSNARHVNVIDDASLDQAGSLTVSAWIQTTDAQSDTGVIAAKWGASGNRNYWLGKYDASTIAFYVDDTQNVTANLSLVNDGAWHYVAGVADAGNNLLRLFVDGVERATAPYSGATQTGSSDLHIGDSPDIVFQEFDGRLDEVRVVGAARIAAWIQTEFNNQNSPSGFYGVGAEEFGVACTPTPTATATDTPAPTATDTPTATATLSGCAGDVWPSPYFNLGPPDGSFFSIGCGQSVIVDLGASPIVTHAGFDFVYYERFTAAVPGIYMDTVVVEVCSDASCTVSYPVFDWSDGALDLNTNIGAAGYTPTEPDNDPIPEAVLYGIPPLQVGITIDVDAVAPAGTYGYLRLSAPGAPLTDGAEVDAVEVIPLSPTSTPSNTPTPTPSATAVSGTTLWMYDDMLPLTYMMYPSQPSGASSLSTGNVTFFSEVAAGGELLPAGTMTAYLNARTDVDRGLTLVISAGMGASWTALGSTTQTVNTGGVVALLTVPVANASHIFSAGERLRLEVQGSFGVMPNGVYWDGAYNDSRLVAPAIPATSTPTPTATATSSGSVAIDGTASTGQTTTSSLTISHTTSGTDRLMLVGVSIADDTGGAPAVSSVTYNGAGLSLIGSRATSDGFGRVGIWGLLAPATGTHDVVVTFASAPDSATAGVLTFTGVDQATPLGAFASGDGDSASGSVTGASAAGELVFGAIVVESSSNFNLIPEAGQAEQWDLFQAPKANGGASTEAGAASVDMLWSWASPDKWAIGVISIRPSPPTATPTPTPTNTPTAGAYRSLEFDGINDRVALVDLPLLTEFTLEAWVKRTADGSNYETFVSDANAGYGEANFTLYIDGNSADCGAPADQFAYFQRPDLVPDFCSGSTATLNSWRHVAVVRTSGGILRYFVDGNLQAVGAGAAPGDSSGTLTFGRAGDFDGEYFTGLIAEVKISDIALYSADFTPPSGPMSAGANTVGLWLMDEGSGQTVADTSGNGRNGVLGTSSGAESSDPLWSTDHPY